MPQLRRDPITKRWVLMVEDEHQLLKEPVVKSASDSSNIVCPFCPGNEAMTPNEIMSYRQPNTLPNEKGWTIRVIPNKFPALGITGDLERLSQGLYDTMNGVGSHEIIIESSDHNDGFHNYSVDQIKRIIHTYVDRVRDLRRDRRLHSVLIYKNHGLSAGTTLTHPHSQLIAAPIIPKRLMEEIEGAKRFFYYKERCVYCDLVKQELTSGDRIISENEYFVSMSPFASRFPFEICIIPKDHKDSFGDIDNLETESLAYIMQNTFQRLNKLFDNPDFNFVIHSSPYDEHCSDYYHWHIEIVPRLSSTSTLEWGSGFYVNPISPEKATKKLLSAAKINDDSPTVIPIRRK